MDEQTRDKIRRFIDTVSDAAKSAADQLRIPVIAIMAQWAYESGWGTSQLAAKYNNYGGIKSGGDWNGEVVILGTDEKDHSEHIAAAFRVYPDVQSYADDYVKLLKKERYSKVLNTDTVRDFATALIDAGYCQDSVRSYAEALESIAERISNVMYLNERHEV